MKIAHSVIITPHHCGLYETTRELVSALRGRGHDARMVDPKPNEQAFSPAQRASGEERGVPIADMAWARDADIVINHSGCDGTPLQHLPQILVCHGRPRYSFLGERNGGTPVLSYHLQQDKAPHVRGVVTFWPEHARHHEALFAETPVHYVQPPVDLDAWSPGPRGYGFGGKRGAVNVVCTDSFLPTDIDPYYAMAAFSRWSRDQGDVRLHAYARPRDLKGYTPLIAALGDRMGELKARVKGLEHVYRAADFVLTGHSIHTRSVREALACGCPVARVQPDLTFSVNKDRDAARRSAETLFDPAKTAEQFEALL